MMKLTMLGTGNALVTDCYNTCFVMEEGEEAFLVDGGGGNQILTQLKKAGVDLEEIHTVFVTHKHIDHIMGIIWIIRLICQKMAAGKFEGEVKLYAHGDLIALITEMCNALLQKKQTRLIGDRFHLIEVKDGEEKKILGRKVTFFDIHSTKAKQFGFTMDLGGGEKLTCCGDEPYTDCEKKYAEKSTWLMHEAFCLFSEADKFRPYEKNHSTVKDACGLAEELKAENLILYHTEDHNLKHRKELYTAEGREYYGGKLFVPDDLESFEI